MLPRMAWALVLGLSGCASVPNAPGGPLQPAGTVQFAETQVYDFSHAQVQAEGDRSADEWLGDAGGALLGGWVALPVRLGGRVAVADWLDASADWSFSTAGLEVRAGRGEGAGRVPFAVAVAGRTDKLANLPVGERIGNQHDLRLRFEAYPRLWLSPVNPSIRAHGVLALGVSTGRRFHAYHVFAYESPLVRDEDRLEGAVGVEYRRRHFVGNLTVMPYYVLRASRFQAADCSFGDCLTSRATGYRQSFGVTIVLSLGVALFTRP